MGLVIDLVIDGADHGVEFDIEVRRDSIILLPTRSYGVHQFHCTHSDTYGWYVEVDKKYLKDLVKMLAENPDLWGDDKPPFFG